MKTNHTSKFCFQGETVLTRLPHDTVGVLLLVVALVTACAQPVEDINLVQPHYTPKSIFTGQWHYKQTVVDMSPEASMGFIGLEAELEKVEWKITEDYLFAMRTHESIPGLDQDEILEGSTYEGDPVAAFPIWSHFDIRRAYNASTGEETNVIVENNFDRPWYERQYMRVDWSANLLDGPVSLGAFNYVSQATDYIRETELSDPDALLQTDDYIQVTQQMTLSDGGRTCRVMYGSACGSAHGRVRLSFARIDPSVQFEPRSYLDFVDARDGEGRKMRSVRVPVPLANPREYRDFACTEELLEFLNASPQSQEQYDLTDCEQAVYFQFNRFGFFRAERYEYDRRVGGGHDDNRQYHASQHNIWRDPYYTDSDGNRQSKPFANRTPKPIVYYLNVGFPDDLLETTAQMSNDWDEAFIGAATAAMRKDEDSVRELLRSTSDGQDWMYLPGDELKQGGMFQIRRNTCSHLGLSAYLKANPQFADIVDAAVAGLPIDINAKVVRAFEGSSPAVKRGQLPSMCAEIRQRSLLDESAPTFVWQQVGDVRFSILNWVNEQQPSGPLGYGPSSVDKETGQIVNGSANMYGAAVDTYARNAADIVRFMNQDLDYSTLVSGASYADWFDAGTSFGEMPYEMTDQTAQELRTRTGNFDVEEAYGDYHFEDGRVDAEKVVRQMQERLHNPLPQDPMYGPSRLPVDHGHSRLKALQQDPFVQNRLIDHNTAAIARQLFDLGFDEELTEEARSFAAELQFDPKSAIASYEETFRFFSEQNMYHQDFIDDAVIGQALSMKGMDPEDIYQTLRRQIYRAVALHEIGHTVGMTHNFEASRDALNYPNEFWQIRHDHESEQARLENRLPEYRYSSIMDYGSRFNADTKGLGKYDLAAIKFSYGHSTEIFSPELEVDPSYSYRAFVGGYEVIPSLLEDGDGDPNNNYLNIQKRVDKPISDAIRDWEDGMMANTQRFLENPNRPIPDYWLSDEVPYNYCFDIFRGNLDCQTWDDGTSYTETVRSAIQNYWSYYAFNYFRRGRTPRGFVSSAMNREARLEWFLTTFYRFYYFYQQWDIGLRDDLLEASLVGLNFINQVLGTPEPGTHCLDEASNTYVPAFKLNQEQIDNCQRLEIPNGVGRHHNIRFSEDYYEPVIDYYGTFMAKLRVLYSLSDTSAAFFRVANTADQRFFSIGYYRVFKQELLELLRNMMFTWLGVEKGNAFNPYAMADQIAPRALVAPEAFGQAPEDMIGTPQVQAPMGYDTVFQAFLLATVFNTSSFDSVLDFDEYITISEAGSSDDRDYPEAWDVVTFTHPQTGVVFRAAQTSDNQSLSYDLLAAAQAFSDSSWRPAWEAWSTDPSAENRSRLAEADITLGRFNDMIGDLRWLRGRVDRGDD